MFKLIPKTSNLYEMSVEGQIRRTDGKECVFTILNNEPAITLVIYGEEKTVSLEWLRLITHFEVDLKKNDLFRIYFVDINKKYFTNKPNKTMVFKGKHPEYKPGFRIIPNFTRYAISKEGIIIDSYTNKNVSLCIGNVKRKTLNGILTEIKNGIKRYITANIYNPDKNEFRSTVVHKLVALAWVKNPNPMELYMVNHKDGNKHNPHASNLEWCDYSGNVQHAVANQLVNSIPCKIFNIKTNEVTEHIGLGDASRYIGLPAITSSVVLLTGTIKGIYKIKLLNDNTSWSENIYIDKTKIVQTYQLATNSILEFDNYIEAANSLHMNINTIKRGLFKGEQYVVSGHAFRYKTDKPWDNNFIEIINKPKRILAINKNGEQLDCFSVKHANRLTRINRKAINRSLNGEKINFDWYFKYKE